MKRLIYCAGLILLVGAMGSCKKDADKSTLNIRLTDGPGPYTEVNIDLRAIEVTGDSTETLMLDVTPGMINLLDFSNGVDTLIGTGLLEPGTIEQIRLVLGPNNTVKVDGTTYPLSTPSAEQSGLKLQVHRTFEAGVVYNILLDFDAHNSIVKTGNGNYKLKPVVRTIITSESGSIKGKISPAGTAATIVATSGADSYSGPANANGDFLIMGVPPGTYSVSIIHELSPIPVLLEGVVVTVGNTTNLGTIEL